MLIEVNGIKLNVELEGKGPPLLLLHGFTGSTKSWKRIISAFKKQYQLILPDMIGHGLSEAPDDFARYSMEHAVQDLLYVLDYLGLKKISLLGYSMGGRCALRFAVHWPERLHTLILESSSPGIENCSEREERKQADEALAAFIEKQGVEAFVNKWTNLDLFATQRRLPDCIKEEVRLERLKNNAKGLANSLRGMGTGVQESLWHNLKAVTVPTLLLVGEKDAKFRQIGLSMSEMIVNSTLAVIPDAGHTIHLEQPDLFATTVKKFLSLYT